MFIKLLVLLISNVFTCFSVLLCCRSLTSKSCTRWKEARSPCLCDWAHRLMIRHTCDQAYGPGLSTPQSSAWAAIKRIHVYLRSLHCPRSSHSRLRRGILEWLCAIERIECTVIERGPCDRAYLLFPNSIHFPINSTTCVNFESYVF